ADMGAFVRNVDDLRERTGAHVLAIHHAGKDVARGLRGHSSLLGAVDTEVKIADKRITSPNQRDLEDDLDVRFKLRPVAIGFDATDQRVVSCVVKFLEVD